jgi:hypothetical protein
VGKSIRVACHIVRQCRFRQITLIAPSRYAVGMCLCPAAGVKSSCKSRFTPGTAKRPRHELTLEGASKNAG